MYSNVPTTQYIVPISWSAVKEAEHKTKLIMVQARDSIHHHNMCTSQLYSLSKVYCDFSVNTSSLLYFLSKVYCDFSVNTSLLYSLSKL